MRIALYQPDQPGNVGSILRLGACLDVPIDIIEPCGFAFSDRALKRSGMDYIERAELVRHSTWNAFLTRSTGRLVLMTSQGDVRLPEARFLPGDTLVLGSESRGAPPEVHACAALRLRIPQTPGTRSLNIAVAAGIALAEGLRQTRAWPND